MLSFPRSILLSYQNIMQANHHAIASLMKTVGLPKIEQSRLIELCKLSIEKLKKQSTLIRINGPAVVVGDIHGSVIDLLRIFGVYGFPFMDESDNINKQSNNRFEYQQSNFNSSLKYIFLGDYVDRGEFSVEVVTLLLSAFCSFPNNIILLRGNHEFLNVSSSNGFKDEILDHPAGYSPELFERIHDVFSYLPYAAVINNNVFCVHGGLSNRLTTLQDIEKLSELRPIYDYKEIPLIQDLVWSDPSPIGCCDFIPSTRNQGCVYGSAAVNNFYHNTGIQAIIRGHSYVKGVAIYSHINLLSVFSSSNYLKIPFKLKNDEQNNNYHSFYHSSAYNENDIGTNNELYLEKSGSGNLSGIVFVDEESKISPEIFEAVESVSRKETKLRNVASIAFASSQTISSIPFVPINKTDFANDNIQIKQRTTDCKEKPRIFDSESNIKSKEHMKKNKSTEINMNPDNISKPNKHFSVLFNPKMEEESTVTPFIRKSKYQRKRKLSHGSLQKVQCGSSFINFCNDDHADDSSSATTNSISESSSSSSNSGKTINNDPFEKIGNNPVFIKASLHSKKKKAKKSLPNMNFHNLI